MLIKATKKKLNWALKSWRNTKKNTNRRWNCRKAMLSADVYTILVYPIRLKFCKQKRNSFTDVTNLFSTILQIVPTLSPSRGSRRLSNTLQVFEVVKPLHNIRNKKKKERKQDLGSSKPASQQFWASVCRSAILMYHLGLPTFGVNLFEQNYIIKLIWVNQVCYCSESWLREPSGFVQRNIRFIREILGFVGATRMWPILNFSTAMSNKKAYFH